MERELRRAHFDMEEVIGYILLTGVLLSIALIVVGLVWNLALTGTLRIAYLIRTANLSGFIAREAGQVASGHITAGTFIILGIIVLMLTPYLRVLGSMLYFTFAEHNWKYSLFTGFVLAVLTYALFIR